MALLTADWPYPPSFLSVVSFAVDSLALTSLAIANFLASPSLVGSVGLAALVSELLAASPCFPAFTGFFSIAIFVYRIKARLPPVLTLR